MVYNKTAEIDIFCSLSRDELQQLLEEEDTEDSNENKFVEEYRQLMSENVSNSVWYVSNSRQLVGTWLQTNSPVFVSRILGD